MRRWNYAIALATAAAMLAAPSIAMAAEETVGKEGVFTMIVAKVGKKFNRCIMHQAQGPHVLRIASASPGIYSLSIPTAGQGKGMPMGISIDGGGGYGVILTGQDQVRSWATLPPAVATAIKAGRRTINVELGTARYAWRLNSTMKDSFMVLDSCVEGYLNGA